MDRQKLTALLHQQNTEIPERTPFCPDDHEISVYFDRKAHRPDGDMHMNHLVNCAYCLARVAVLAQLHRDDDDEQIPEALLAAAGQFGHQPRRRLRYASTFAAAAVVIITLFAVAGRGPALMPGSGAEPPPTSQTLEDARQLRTIERSNLAPTIVAPVNGADIRPGDLTIRWTRVPGSLYYDVRVVTAEGFLVWQDRIEANQLQLPADLNLLPGSPYFVRVDAYLAEAKSVNSQHVQFTIKGEN